MASAPAPHGGPERVRRQRRIPLWISLAHTALVCALIPVYWRHYGPANFLWFSDVALFGAAVALWLENRLIASMMLLATVLPELVWNADFFTSLTTGWHPVGMTEYMFDRSRPLYLRALSLFHVYLPVLLVWMVWTLGYDRRALLAQTLLAWVILLATYFLTDPEQNINWVFGPGNEPQQVVSPRVYLIAVMALFPLAIYLPMHAICIRLVGNIR